MKTALKLMEEISARPQSNRFEEEIERAKNAFEAVQSRIRDQKVVRLGSLELTDYVLSEYDEQKLSFLREQGLTSQPIPGLKYYESHLGSYFWRVGSGEVSLEQRGIYPIEAPESKYFRYVFRSENERHGFNENEILAITHEDVEANRCGCPRPMFIYVVGTAMDKIVPMTALEKRKTAQPLMAEYVFGIQPPTSEEITEQLKTVHGLTGDYHINWIGPELLYYPMPDNILDVFVDANKAIERGLFSRLEFGNLAKGRIVLDPVLAGIYEDQRIPLAYWK